MADERMRAYIAGDNVAGDKVGGDKVAGDKITVSNVEAGAKFIINNIQKAVSSIEEMEKGIQAAERALADAIQRKLEKYVKLEGEPVAIGPDDRRNPYKALLDYKLEDAPYFFGRTEAMQALMERMRQSRLTVLHSESGSGKTSLLQAGLSSRLLAEGHFPLYLRPYQQPPTQAIKNAFLSDFATRPETARFRDDQMSLRGFLERVTYYLSGRRLYIFLDQFEEFFTEIKTEAQATFAEQLRECIQSDLPVWWVLALRKEYFSDLRLFHLLKPFDNNYFLSAFNLNEAREVITEPAMLKGFSYEDGLVGQIIDDLRDEEEFVSPAQAQLVCYTLFEEFNSQTDNHEQIITYALYNKKRGRGEGLSGASGILNSHLSGVLSERLQPDERQLAQHIFEELVSFQKRRKVKTLAELRRNLPNKNLENVLDILVNSRLLRLDNRLIYEGDAADEICYELAHDYLLNEIELDPETQRRKLAREMLVNDVFVWKNQEHEEILIAEDRLLLIERYLNLNQMTHDERQLVQRSRQAIDEQKQVETERLKRELATQRQLTLRTRSFLLVVSIIAIALAVGPIRRFYWSVQAANGVELISIQPEEARQALCPQSPENNSLCLAMEQGLIEPFNVEKYEVSNGRYALCVQAGACTVPDSERYADMAQRETVDGAANSVADYPVQGVNALQASAFCHWIGRSLPTDWQWMMALGNFDETDVHSHRLGLVSTIHHESYAGVVNLLGNVSEWTRSYYQEDINLEKESLWDERAETLSFDEFLTIRGNSYFDFTTKFSANGRLIDVTIGFRCIADRR